MEVLRIINPGPVEARSPRVIQTYILNEKALQDKNYKQLEMEFG